MTSNGNIEITGNTFEILPTLASQSVDLIIADPPYFYHADTKHWLQEQFKRICKGTIIVFSPPENQWILPADQYLFWIKPISTKNTSRRYSRFVEMIFLYGSAAWNANRHWSQYTNVFMDLVDDAKFHPYRKPPTLIARLIRNHTNPGDLILDPFAGSFVVLQVAKALNRKCYAIEKEGR